jgi:hypothetical protein
MLMPIPYSIPDKNPPSMPEEPFLLNTIKIRASIHTYLSSACAHVDTLKVFYNNIMHTAKFWKISLKACLCACPRPPDPTFFTLLGKIP